MEGDGQVRTQALPAAPRNRLFFFSKVVEFLALILKIGGPQLSVGVTPSDGLRAGWAARVHRQGFHALWGRMS